MTTPPREIEVECPACGIRFVTWHRPSVNLSLGEKWSKKDLDKLRFVNCERCNFRFEKELMVVQMDIEKNELILRIESE
jgi:DNA-directed RNA polymerase subunit RPC12/RpoP